MRHGRHAGLLGMAGFVFAASLALCPVGAAERLQFRIETPLPAGFAIDSFYRNLAAEIAPPPPPFALHGQAAAFFNSAERIGVQPLEWEPPTLDTGPPAENKPDSERAGEKPAPPPPTGPPETQLRLWKPVAEPEAKDRNQLPSTLAILKNQEAVIGRPEEVAERARRALAQHGFPLP